jgi:hypothetical protein
VNGGCPEWGVRSRTPARREAGDRAQGIVEFAVIFPLFILLVFIMIDGGILMGRYNQVNHSAQEGARLAATGASESEILSHVRAQSIDLLNGVPRGCPGGDREYICIQWYDGDNTAGEVGSYVRVEVSYRYNFVTPLDAGPFGVLGFEDDIHVKSCAIARIERPIPSPPNDRSGMPSC